MFELIFFKMPWCPHCVHFDVGDPRTGMPPQWPILQNDPALKGRVTFKRIEWNEQTGGKYPIMPRPKGYEFVNYGPYFWLESGKDASGRPVGSTYKGQASPKDIASWILSIIDSRDAVATPSTSQPIKIEIPLNKPPQPKGPVNQATVLPKGAAVPRGPLVNKNQPSIIKARPAPGGDEALAAKLRAMKVDTPAARPPTRGNNNVPAAMPSVPSTEEDGDSRPIFSYRRKGRNYTVESSDEQ